MHIWYVSKKSLHIKWQKKLTIYVNMKVNKHKCQSIIKTLSLVEPTPTVNQIITFEYRNQFVLKMCPPRIYIVNCLKGLQPSWHKLWMYCICFRLPLHPPPHTHTQNPPRAFTNSLFAFIDSIIPEGVNSEYQLFFFDVISFLYQDKRNLLQRLRFLNYMHYFFKI